MRSILVTCDLDNELITKTLLQTLFYSDSALIIQAFPLGHVLMSLTLFLASILFTSLSCKPDNRLMELSLHLDKLLRLQSSNSSFISDNVLFRPLAFNLTCYSSFPLVRIQFVYPSLFWFYALLRHQSSDPTFFWFFPLLKPRSNWFTRC
jgi:hypothetical protein